MSAGFEKIAWHDASGARLTCVEKLRVLAENLSELQAMAQDALEDALVLGVDEGQIREALVSLVKDLKNPYDDKI